MRITKEAQKKTRQGILQTAETLFRDKGYQATTIRDIASAMGLGTGTLFNYFKNKEALAMTLVLESLQLGSQDYLRRRSGSEDFSEELFLYISSGLRRLKPYRQFAGPVLESALSPFAKQTVCEEGQAAREEHLETIRQIINHHGFSAVPDYISVTMYWSLYLGILAFWSNDNSPKQEETKALLDYSIRLFSRTLGENNKEEHNDL